MGKTSQGTKRIEGTITLKKREAFDLKHCAGAAYPMQCLCISEHLQKNKVTITQAHASVQVGTIETFRKWTRGLHVMPAFMLPALVKMFEFSHGKKAAMDFEVDFQKAMNKELLFRREIEEDRNA